MRPAGLELSAQLAARIELGARRTRPLEFCGALLGAQQDELSAATDLIALRNSDTRHGRFSISDAELAHAQLAGRERNRALVAIVHSHPRSPPELSAADLASIRLSRYLWAVAGFDEHDHFELAAFQPPSAKPVAVLVRGELHSEP